MLSFWFNCLAKAFGDSAAFIGTNQTGIWFTVIVAAVSLWRAVKPQVDAEGWSSLRRTATWQRLVGEGALIGIVAFTVVWIGHFIAAPYGLYTEVEAKRAQAVSGASQDSSKWVTERDSLRERTAEYKSECAVKDAVSQTLQQQNRDQQATINGCLADALKLLAPEPLAVTGHMIPSEQQRRKFKLAANVPEIDVYMRSYVVVTNRIQPPTRLLVDCPAAQLVAEVRESILGTNAQLGGGWGGRMSVTAYGVGILSPAWTPKNPIWLTISGTRDPVGCRFSLS